MQNFPLPPVIHPIRQLLLPPVQTFLLGNGMRVFCINMGTQEVVRVEVVFWAGRPFEQQRLAAKTTNALLREGAGKYSSQSLAETIDYYGAELALPYLTDTANVAISCPLRNLEACMEPFMAMLTEPHFSESELEAFKRRQLHELREDLSKNEVLAYRQITEAFWGATHAYGYNTSTEDYANLQVHHLQAHFSNTYNASNGFAIITGKVDEATLGIASKYLNELPMGIPAPRYNLDAQPGNTKLLKIKNNSGGAQNAIRMGRPLFNRQHPDAPGIYCLTHLLGGYFGSRLNANIREDKGYTYHIGASYDALHFDGALFIDCEVSPSKTTATLKEIQVEMDKLCHELVPEKELSMLKNYLMGAFLSMMDGPFHWAETVRALYSEGTDLDGLNKLIYTVQNITPEDIQRLAQQYFTTESFYTVIAGNKIR